METKTTVSWYAARMGNDHQGLIIDEKTGRNVAVSYDKADAALIAAAPDLLAALKDVLESDGDLDAMDFRMYRDAIQKAEG